MIAFTLRLVLFFVLLATLASSLSSQVKTVPAQKKLAIAVLDFDTRGGMSKDEAASLSDIFQARLVNTGEFLVVDRNRIKAILQEQGFQRSEECSQVECVVDVGRILKVQKMFAGTIGKVGSIFNVNVMLIDVATAQIAYTENRQHSGALEDLATSIIPDIARTMANQLLGKEVQITSSSVSGGGIGWYWYVGGAVVAGGIAAAVLAKPSSSPSGENALPTPPAMP